MTTRWIITGGRGQLGRALARELREGEDCELVAAFDHAQLDIADPEAVSRVLGDALSGRADVLVNAAAFNHVDRCESEPDAARRVNGDGPGLLAEACRSAGVKLVHVSTDYVFDGQAERPYREDDPPAPQSAYGRSKLEGERRVLAASPEFLAVRTSWVYGEGRNFVGAVLEQARRRQGGEVPGPLRVVDDQRGRPTYAQDLAEGIRAAVERDASGLLHLANRGIASWWELARAALDESGFAEVEIERIATDELSLPAPRPRFSALDCSRARDLGIRLRIWRDALIAYLRSPESPLARRGAQR